MKNLAEELHEFLVDGRSRVRDFEIDNYQTGMEPTDYGRYLSAIRRMESCLKLIGKEGVGKRPDQELIARRLFAQCRELRSRLGDLSDPAVLKALDADHREHKIRMQVAIDIQYRICGGFISRGVIEALFQMPKAFREEIFNAAASDPSKLLDPFLNKPSGGDEFSELPPIELTDSEMETLLLETQPALEDSAAAVMLSDSRPDDVD